MSDERVIRWDQNNVVLGAKSTNLKPGINQFNLRFFWFSGWTGRFLLFTVVFSYFRFFIITGPDLMPVPGWTSQSGPVFKTMQITYNFFFHQFPLDHSLLCFRWLIELVSYSVVVKSNVQTISSNLIVTI